MNKYRNIKKEKKMLINDKYKVYRKLNGIYLKIN